VPSKSKKQHNFMAAVANNPKFARKAGVSQSVGADFMKADKGKKNYRGGGLHMIPGYQNRGFVDADEFAGLEGMEGLDVDPEGIGMSPDDFSVKKKTPSKKRKKKKKKTPKTHYYTGGRVRGSGAAKQGVRKAKMIIMKGS
jgi:hypothetical protein